MHLTEEINLSLFAKPGVTFSEEDTREDNTDVLQGSPKVASIPKTRFKTNQASREEIESTVHEEVCYTTKEINKLIHSFDQKSAK